MPIRFKLMPAEDAVVYAGKVEYSYWCSCPKIEQFVQEAIEEARKLGQGGVIGIQFEGNSVSLFVEADRPDATTVRRALGGQ